MSALPKSQLTRFYRSLYRNGLKAVNYRAPQKYVFAAELRKRFELTHPTSVSESALENTTRFFHNAAHYTGMEARIVTNLVHTAFSQSKGTSKKHAAAQQPLLAMHRSLVSQLNKQFNLCL